MSTVSPTVIPPQHSRVSAGSTPFWRIALAVFTGLVLWTILMALISGLTFGLIAHEVTEQINKGTITGELSAPCRAAIEQGADQTIPCAGDNPDLVAEYSGGAS